jgi:hypothetical protein
LAGSGGGSTRIDCVSSAGVLDRFTGAVLGRLGAVLGRLGAVLGRHGAVLGRIGAVLGMIGDRLAAGAGACEATGGASGI